MAKRKSRKKKKRRPPRHRKLVSRLKQQGLLKGRKILYQPAGYEKMSEVVLDFIEPYREYATTQEAFRKLIVLAIVAWNVSQRPDEEAKAMIEEVVDGQPLSKSDRKEMIHVIEELIERKKKHFAKYTRDILDYELTETEDGFHLSVVSVLPVDNSGSEKQ